jgi:hypothetical protein
MASDLSRHMAPSTSPSRADPTHDETEAMDQQLRWREALVCWLRWNEAYENVTATMYDKRQSPEQLERLMDQMDALRRHAIELSHQLLD